jgi:hypothetical protein
MQLIRIVLGTDDPLGDIRLLGTRQPPNALAEVSDLR